MKNGLKYTLGGILIALFIAGTVLLVITADRQRSQLVCKGLSVYLADDYRFVNEDDVRKIIVSRYGSFLGVPADSIALGEMEKVLNSQSAILKSEAWMTDDGMLNVSITQRKPVIRFMNGQNGYYIDETGYVFPLIERFTAAVPVIEGPSPSDPQWRARAIEMVGFMSNGWTSMIESIHSDRNGNLSLKMEGLEEEFYFGKPEDFDSKFRKIRQYCKTIRPLGNQYSMVNLSFEGQIICKQKAEPANN